MRNHIGLMSSMSVTKFDHLKKQKESKQLPKLLVDILTQNTNSNQGVWFVFMTSHLNSGGSQFPPKSCHLVYPPEFPSSMVWENLTKHELYNSYVNLIQRYEIIFRCPHPFPWIPTVQYIGRQDLMTCHRSRVPMSNILDVMVRAFLFLMWWNMNIHLNIVFLIEIWDSISPNHMSLLGLCWSSPN